jgi:MoxR-like ATPase
MHDNIHASSAALAAAIREAGRGLVGRQSLVETIALAAVAGEHILVIGPPGTAKSEAARRFARALSGRYFEYLLGRFTEPGEIFGPVDFRKLKEGVVETDTTGMLPEAEIAFLDEVFQGSTAILNTLLGILNERMFRRGRTMLHVPLRICIGASNALPVDESLAAFADRFLVRVFVEPTADPELEDLLAGGWSLLGATEETQASIHDLELLATAAREADLGPVRSLLAHAIRRLRQNGVSITDRRAVKVQKLIGAAAVLAGRTTPTAADLWPIVTAVPLADQQAIARETLSELLGETENAALTAAAEEASHGPRARAARLVGAAKAVLDESVPESDPRAQERWRYRVEGIAREIDSGFAPEQLTPELAEIRTRVAQVLAPEVAVS